MPLSRPPGVWDFWMWQCIDEQHRVEDINYYRQGGFCPIHLGDLFDDQTYTVVYKLGHSKTSTVWLARDNSYNPTSKSERHPFQYVALKVLAADQGPREIRILERLRDAATYSETSTSGTWLSADSYRETDIRSVLRLIYYFTHESPNGIHQVLVMPIIRPLIELRQATADTPEYYLNIAQQLSSAVAYLHSNGVVHGDLYYRNAGYLCEQFSDEDFSKLESPTIHPTALWPSQPPWPTYSPELCIPSASLDPGIGLRLPKYLMSWNDWGSVSDEFKTYTKEPRICIFDFGGAFTLDTPLSERPLVGLPWAFRPPEYVFPTHRLSQAGELPVDETNDITRRHGDAQTVLGEISQQVDIWAFGCTIGNLLGFYVSPTGFGGCPVPGTDAEILLKVDPHIPKDWGKLPVVARAQKSIGEERDQANVEAWRQIANRVGKRYTNLAQDQAQENRPPPFDSTRLEGLIQLCRYMLRSDPRQRPSAMDVVKRIEQTLEDQSSLFRPQEET